VGNDKLRIVASDAHSDDETVQDVKQEVESLMTAAATHETTLIAFSKDMPFLDFVRLSWRWQQEGVADHVEDLQLVLFHPHATHQTYSEMTSASDYTIRSPYPTVHLLREVDAMKAVLSGYPDLVNLPARNKEKLEKQGLEVCKQRLAACYVADETPKPSWTTNGYVVYGPWWRSAETRAPVDILKPKYMELRNRPKIIY
jgi:hypothetical protein